MDLNSSEVVGKIKAAIEPELAVFGLDIYDIEYKQETMGMTLKVFLDRPGGKVTLLDCQNASRRIDELIETTGIIAGKYVLEVSTVGLDRELRTKKDFDRFKGSEVRVVARIMIGKDNTFTGSIAGCDEEAAEILTAKGVVKIPLKEIAKARLEIKF